MTLKPVYYIYGTDDYLIDEAVGEIRSVVRGGFESMNCHVFEGKGLDASEVVAAASTLPAFSDKRVVIVKGAESIKEAVQKELIPYIQDPLSSTCLVFVSLAGKVDKNSLFIKCLNEKGYLKALNRLSERELALRVRKEAGRQGKSISDGAVDKLIATAGDRLRDVKGELDKIILFAGEKSEIDARDVEDAGLDCREETIFGLSDAIGTKDVKSALRIFDKISAEEPLKVLGAISRQIRILLKIKALQRKKTSSQAMPSILGVPPFSLESYVKRSRHFTEKELESAIRKLSRADIDLKTGRRPESIVLPSLIMELCGH